MQFKQATRTGVKPLIGLYGESGCGKTYSALLLARGIVGPQGRIAMIDSESGRGSLYADILPGGYETLELAPPFAPHRYVEAIEVAEKSGFECLVIDSVSHAWEGSGGTLEQAGEIEEKKGKGLHCWNKPKMEHQRMVLRLLQTPLIVICCLRAKHKSRQVKNNGKTEIIKDEFCTPIQADDFIFEMTAHCEIVQNHTIRLTKCSHPDLGACFPKDFEEPLSIRTGELIAQWCRDPGPKAPAPQQSEDEAVRRDDLLSVLKEIAQNQFEGKSPTVVAELKRLGIMRQSEKFNADMSTDRMDEIVTAAREALK